MWGNEKCLIAAKISGSEGGEDLSLYTIEYLGLGHSFSMIYASSDPSSLLVRTEAT
jgi:hypothetical protein